MKTFRGSLKSELIELKKIKTLRQKAALEKRLNHKSAEVREEALKRLVVLNYKDEMCLPCGCYV